MSTSIWAVGVLILACAVFLVWRLVVLTKQPRKYFRAGTADPEQGLFTAQERANRAPDTVREPVKPGVMETTVDEEAAELIQGPQHDAPPITSNVDRQAEEAMDETLGDPEAENDTGPTRHAGRDKGEVFQRERRRMAAAEHRRAAEEHRRAAEAMTPEEQAPPADKPADGRQQTRRGGTQPS